MNLSTKKPEEEWWHPCITVIDVPLVSSDEDKDEDVCSVSSLSNDDTIKRIISGSVDTAVKSTQA